MMSDPSLLVTHLTSWDNSSAPPDRDTCRMQVPVPAPDPGRRPEVSHRETPPTCARVGSSAPGTLPSNVVSTCLAVGVPMLQHSGRLAALRVLA